MREVNLGKVRWRLTNSAGSVCGISKIPDDVWKI